MQSCAVIRMLTHSARYSDAPSRYELLQCAKKILLYVRKIVGPSSLNALEQEIAQFSAANF
jgi:hypothetical protein